MSEHAPTGIAVMEARADSALSETERLNAIEARIATPEVQTFNDMAQMEIYGSGARTYTDPETGDVIASPANPVKGKLEDITRDPKYGKTPAERDAYAARYESQLNELLDSDFQLCQAKMIMDMREEDRDKAGHLAGKYISQGMDPNDAADKAEDYYARKDAQRLGLIKDGGAFTPDEYEAVRKGEDLYDPNRRAEEDEALERLEDFLNQKQEKLNGHNAELADARTKLATIREARERKTINLNKEYSKASLEAALAEYDEALATARDSGLELVLANNGLFLDSLDQLDDAQYDALLNEPAVKSTLNWAGAVEGAILAQKQTEMELERNEGRSELTKRFLGFIARNSQGKFFSWEGLKGNVKKGIALLPVGAAAAVVASPFLAAGGVAAGGIAAGGVIGTRIAAGIAGAKINKEAHARTVAEAKRDGRRAEVDEAITAAERRGELFDMDDLTGEKGKYASDTREVVGQNRKRTAKIAGVTGALALLMPFGARAAGDFLGDRIAGFVPQRTQVLPKQGTGYNPFDHMNHEQQMAFIRMDGYVDNATADLMGLGFSQSTARTLAEKSFYESPIFGNS